MKDISHGLKITKLLGFRSKYYTIEDSIKH